MTRRPLELEGLDDPIQRRGAMEDPVEAVLASVGVPVDVAPSATVFEPRIGRRPSSTGRGPSHCVSSSGSVVGAVQELGRGVELAGDRDHGDRPGSATIRVFAMVRPSPVDRRGFPRHRVSPCRRQHRSAGWRGGRRAVRGSHPRTPDNRPARPSPPGGVPPPDGSGEPSVGASVR